MGKEVDNSTNNSSKNSINKEKEKKEKEKEKKPTIPIHKLFKYASFQDSLLIIGGIICSAAVGNYLMIYIHIQKYKRK